jgi:hypothetical protein
MGASKLAYHLDGVGQAPYRHSNAWKREPAGNTERLVIGPQGDFIDLVMSLTACLQPPYAVLYVLSVPRGGSEPGRYQLWDRLDLDQLSAFVEPYRSYLEGDARHHLWIHSLDSAASIVYDKHDLIYAYGPLDCYLQTLTERGLTEGEVELPFPHYHNYFEEFDSMETQIIAGHTWRRTPIVPGVDD